VAWNECDIERITYGELVKQLGQDPAKERFALYLAARKAVVEDILPEIRAILPEHTDHGVAHAVQVLDKAATLLGLDAGPSVLSGMDLYALVLAILFHDVGNIFGRAEHQRKVSEAYQHACAKGNADKNERYIVVKAAEAHCGQSLDGCPDTLKDLGERVQLAGRPVRLRDIAAILRLADELAEGPERTSRFMQEYHTYPAESDLFHRYAEAADVFIERGTERIALTYNIDIKITPDAPQQLGEEQEKDLRTLLSFIYKRIIKLDQERQYTRHYCNLLTPFRKTTVTFNFWIAGPPCSVELPALTDLVVPGGGTRDLQDYHAEYRLDGLIEKIRHALP